MARPNKPPEADAAEAPPSVDSTDAYEAATAAWLAALSALPGFDDDVARRARQAMADALSGGVAPTEIFDRQWSIMQAAIDSMGTGNGEQNPDAEAALEGARTIFAAASEAIHAVNLAAASAEPQNIDRIMDTFRASLKAMQRRNT